MVTVCVVHCGSGVTVTVALVAPVGTVTEAGTVATLELLLTRVMVIPPDGAGPVSETVPVTGLPPVTEVALSESVDRIGPQ
jgi:hypothetical protein